MQLGRVISQCNNLNNINKSVTTTVQFRQKHTYMKKVILTMALTAMCVGAFAQGKVTFVNDSLHTYMFGSAVLAADAGLAGQLTPITPLPSGVSLRADLYAGTSSGSLFLYSTTTLSTSTPGRQNTLNVTLNDPDGVGAAVGLPGGTPAFFQVQIRDSNFATAALSQAGNSYYGFSSIFNVTPSSSIAFNSIVNPTFSTWAQGNPAITVQIAPEPTSMALAGIGAAAMVIFRRRNK